ncbi:Fibrocystin-L [Desmophyllum pertusum]|uniref:Fibrocystin-L n=1 Tax=Desmophyllum pertusum TaxID=174260 RepID=A0A9W9YE52_9CNID|nr:Fibrocystin-L [Desmophyllum pertusum]
MAGGTVLTIKGKGFDKRTKEVSVEVGGVPCEILSIGDDVIKCQTSEAPPPLSDKDDMYSGARGWLREVWTSTRPSSVSAVGGLKTTASDYHSEVLPEASSPTQASFGESTSFSDRYKSFFVAPSNNNYTFHIQADDQAELYLSLSESAAAKTKIASCSKPTTSWSAFPEQKSAVFSLKKEQRYYLEVRHVQDGGKSHVMIGVKMQKTRYVNSQIGSAVNEEQEIRMNSIKHPEIQVINITSWDDGKTFEVQEVEVIPCNQSEGNRTLCRDVFSLSYDGVNIDLVSLNNMTADSLQRALNNLTSVKKQGHVTVTELITNKNATAYRVTFNFNKPEKTQMLLRVTPVSSNVTSVKITCLQKGKAQTVIVKLLGQQLVAMVHNR